MHKSYDLTRSNPTSRWSLKQSFLIQRMKEAWEKLFGRIWWVDTARILIIANFFLLFANSQMRASSSTKMVSFKCIRRSSLNSIKREEEAELVQQELVNVVPNLLLMALNSQKKCKRLWRKEWRQLKKRCSHNLKLELQERNRRLKAALLAQAVVRRVLDRARYKNTSWGSSWTPLDSMISITMGGISQTKRD